jgi:hypothetical protein
MRMSAERNCHAPADAHMSGRKDEGCPVNRTFVNSVIAQFD